MSLRALRKLNQEDKINNDIQSDSDEERVFQNPFTLLNDVSEDKVDEPEISPTFKISPSYENKVLETNKLDKKIRRNKTKKREKQDFDKELENFKSLEDNYQRNKKITKEETQKGLDLLAINSRSLDYETEAIRLFGSKLVKRESKNRIGRRNISRTKFCKFNEFWPPYNNNGLNMSLLKTKNGIKYFSYTQNSLYRDYQKRFYNSITTHDVQSLTYLHHEAFYHVDTLLQLSDVTRQRGDIATAAELIERSLYALELAFHPSCSVTAGNCYWRTSLEYAKVILSMDPSYDGLYIVQLIDFLALKAKEYYWVLDFFDRFDKDGQPFISNLPNWEFSSALASSHLARLKKAPMIEQKNENNPTNRLARAIIRHPQLFLDLSKKCGCVLPNNQNNNLEKHARKFISIIDKTDESSLKIYYALYMERTFSLWKEKDALIFLLEGANRASELLDDENILQEAERLWVSDYTEPIPLNLCRHVIISDIPSHLKLLPKSLLKTATYAHDPLPPPDSVSQYDDFELLNYRSSSGAIIGEGINNGLFRMIQSVRDMIETTNNAAPENPPENTTNGFSLSGIMNRINNMWPFASELRPTPNDGEYLDGTSDDSMEANDAEE